MPRGDAHRTWFPEMIETLRREWSPSLSDEALIELRDRLDERLQQIRAERKILPPMFFCPRCQKRQRSARPRVSVRALILSFGRFEIGEQVDVQRMAKRWKRTRAGQGLDLFGKPVET